MATKRSSPKRSAKEAKSDLAISYDEFKEHEGQRYTGMKIGRSHKWYYDQGEWKETKIMLLWKTEAISEISLIVILSIQMPAIQVHRCGISFFRRAACTTNPFQGIGMTTLPASLEIVFDAHE